MTKKMRDRALGPGGADLWGKVTRGEVPVTRAYALAMRAVRRQRDGTWRLAPAGLATPRPSRPAPDRAAVEPIPDRLLRPLARVQRAGDVDTPGEAIRLLLQYVEGPGRAKWRAWLARGRRR